MTIIANFGTFEADLSAGELRKQGRLIRLQQQPFEPLRCIMAGLAGLVLSYAGCVRP